MNTHTRDSATQSRDLDLMGCPEHCDLCGSGRDHESALGEHANEAMMNQIEAADQWSHYQAKSIKSAVVDVKMALSSTTAESDQLKLARYEKEQEEIKAEAERKQTAAKSYFHKHEVFARGVTMFQIAIAIAAISALTRKRSFWFVSLIFGAFGCVFLVLAATA